MARDGGDVALDEKAIVDIAAAREVVERAVRKGEAIYGLTTGVGAAASVELEPHQIAEAAGRLIASHRVGQGPPLDPVIVRAATLCLVNGFAGGTVGVRPELVSRYVEALNSNDIPSVPSLGSVGQADLSMLAELAAGVLSGFELAPGEGLPLLSSNAFSTGSAALSAHDSDRLIRAFDAAGALSLEGFAADLSVLDASIGKWRPFLNPTLDRLRSLLAGSRLWAKGEARNLQDPLSFRSIPQVNGSAHDAIAFAIRRVETELNSPQGNPMVVADEDRLVSVANFESLSLAQALDFARIALAPVITSSCERTNKLLDSSWSGLPRGLVGGSSDGLAFMGIAAQSMAAEARLLAAPVSFELASTSHAEGVEDRTALSFLSSERLAEMVGLASRVAAIELLVATQAVELRGPTPPATGIAALMGEVREVCPRLDGSGMAPPSVEPVVDIIRSGALSR